MLSGLITVAVSLIKVTVSNGLEILNNLFVTEQPFEIESQLILGL